METWRSDTEEHEERSGNEESGVKRGEGRQERAPEKSQLGQDKLGRTGEREGQEGEAR